MIRRFLIIAFLLQKNVLCNIKKNKRIYDIIFQKELYYRQSLIQYCFFKKNIFFGFLCYLYKISFISFFINRKKIISFNKNNLMLYKHCYALQKVLIKNTQILHENAFKNCISLQHVFLDKNTKIIKTFAFKNCLSLKCIYIPKTIDKIECNAFVNCISLEKIIFY